MNNTRLGGRSEAFNAHIKDLQVKKEVRYTLIDEGLIKLADKTVESMIVDMRASLDFDPEQDSLQRKLIKLEARDMSHMRHVVERAIFETEDGKRTARRVYVPGDVSDEAVSDAYDDLKNIAESAINKDLEDEDE